jgi:hypothetical protein
VKIHHHSHFFWASFSLVKNLFQCSEFDPRNGGVVCLGGKEIADTKPGNPEESNRIQSITD